jgi:ribA/ribD-fused uncharacterized protein
VGYDLLMHDDIRDREGLLAAIRRGERPKYLFFWGHQPPREGGIGNHCLSQWWMAPFLVDGVCYPSAEHFMMAEKARLFGDDDTLARILEVSHPGGAKLLGREVRGFEEEAWEKVRFEIVVRGNEAKFGQNPALRQHLLGTAGRVLVEASPVDRIWGIGLPANDPRACDPESWRGENLLGFALMEARGRLGGR